MAHFLNCVSFHRLCIFHKINFSSLKQLFITKLIPLAVRRFQASIRWKSESSRSNSIFHCSNQYIEIQFEKSKNIIYTVIHDYTDRKLFFQTRERFLRDFKVWSFFPGN